MRLITFKANSIKYLEKKACSKKYSAISSLLSKNYSMALISLFLLMDKLVQEKHLQCLEVTGKILLII